MFVEFRKSVEHVFNERLSSPLFGSFILSWIVCNWKIIIFLFTSPHSSFVKISYIDYSIGWWKCFFLPSISALAIVSIYPLLSMLIYMLHLIFDRWKYERKIKEEKITPLDPERAFKLRKENADIKSEIEKTIKEKDDQILLEQEQISKVKADLTEQITKYSSLTTDNQRILKQVTTLQSAITDGNKERSELQNTIYALQESMDNKDERLSSMQAEHRAELNSLQHQLDAMSENLDKIESDRKILEVEVKALDENLVNIANHYFFKVINSIALENRVRIGNMLKAISNGSADKDRLYRLYSNEIPKYLNLDIIKEDGSSFSLTPLGKAFLHAILK